MKKILAALALLALVFGGAFAQDLEITGEVKVGADLFSVTAKKWSSAEAVTGSDNSVEPEADWKLIDGTSFNWTDTIITFKVTGDNYGATFAFGAPPDRTMPVNIGNDVNVFFRKVELWLQPASFLKLWAHNGDSAWRAVGRYQGDIDDFDIAYGTYGFNGGFGAVDEFKNGLKADIIIGEAATIELLAGINHPLWLATGKLEDGAGYDIPQLREINIPITTTPMAATFNWENDLEVGAEIANLVALGIGITGVDDFELVKLTTNALGQVTRVTIKAKAFSGNLAENGSKKITPFGRLAPNYGIRVTLPVADIGKFNLNYRLGIRDKSAYLDTSGSDPRKFEKEGYTTATNQFGIFADLGPLFAAMDLPLGLSAGYTGFFTAGEKVLNKDGNKLIDATPIYINGIDLRVTYAVIPDTFTLALHNNATFFTLASGDLKDDKYYTDGLDSAMKDHDVTSGVSRAIAAEEDWTYFRLYNALGLNYAVIPETFSVNLELANDLLLLGNYAKNDRKGKGDGVYEDTFKGLLVGVFNVSEKATLAGGLGLDIATVSSADMKDGDGKAASITTTKFYIPLSVSVKF